LKDIFLKTEIAAKEAFPHEEWVNAEYICFKHKGGEFQIPSDIKNLKVARSRITGKKGDEKILAKEIRQGKILIDRGASVFLIPKIKGSDGKYIPGPDALVNGVLFEFKSITGAIGKVEKHFRDSREQCENVFLRIMRQDITKDAVISKIHGILNDETYKGGTNGNLIIQLKGTGEPFFFKIEDLK
jgi:hypothetical protein